MELTTVNTSERNIHLNFSEYFDKNIPEDYEIFDLSPKRNYIRLGDLIKEIMDYISAEDPEFTLAYLTGSFILHNEEVSSERFYKIVDSIITDKVRELIDNRVEERYEVGLDADTAASKVKNIELQFTDAHAKTLIKVGMVVKLLIPIMSKYFTLQCDGLDREKLLKLNLRVLKFYSDREGFDLFNKFYKLTESRLRSTQYSDTVMWTFLENLSIDINTKIKEINRVAIIEIIPKFEYNRNIVSLLHAFINNQIRFLFTSNFPINFKPVYSKSSGDDSDSNPFDRLESSFQTDEGGLILYKLNIGSTIATLETQLGKVRDEELEDIHGKVPVNRIQTNLVFLFAQKFSSANYESLYVCNKTEYMKLLILTERFFLFSNLPNLAKIIMSKPLPVKRRVSLSKRFVRDLSTSKTFIRLVSSKYNNLSQKILESGLIPQLITNLSKSEFEYKDTGEIISVDPEEMALEVINFLRSIT